MNFNRTDNIFFEDPHQTEIYYVISRFFSISVHPQTWKEKEKMTEAKRERCREGEVRVERERNTERERYKARATESDREVQREIERDR